MPKSKRDERWSLYGERIRDLYYSGLTIREVSKIINIPENSLNRLMRSKGVNIRERGTFYSRGTVDRGYELVSYNGKQYRKHRIVWELNKGRIPKGFIVHHKDGNKLNNNIENLEMMSQSKHVALHNVERVKKKTLELSRGAKPTGVTKQCQSEKQ